MNNINTRTVVFLLVGLVCIFASLTGDPPASFVTSSLKGKKPQYKPIEWPQLGSLSGLTGGGTPKAPSGSTDVNIALPSNTSAAARQAINFALSQVGKPYIYGATGPKGYDCSGLIMAAYASAGISLPRTTYAQALAGHGVAKANLIPGDLVFPDPGHVQIYLGNGQVVEAPHTGTNVRVTNMWGFWKARRVADVISV